MSGTTVPEKSIWRCLCPHFETRHSLSTRSVAVCRYIGLSVVNGSLDARADDVCQLESELKDARR